MSERLEQITLAVTTTGADGSATGTAVSKPFVNGAEVLRVRWDYGATAPATTDASLYETALGATVGLIDSKGNSVTDAVRYPRLEGSDFTGSDGAAITAAEVAEPFRVPAGGTITAALAQCNALAPAATCYVLVRRL